MRRLLIIAAIALAMAACKTSEANYRAAYEKTMAARADSTYSDSTIYTDIRRQLVERTVTLPDGSPVQVRSQMVRVVDVDGATQERLRRFNIVAGQFKQLFNATSLRRRLADGPYPGAFVVQTAEPYYFVVAASFSTIAEADTCLRRLAAEKPVPMKAPLPFILDASTRR